MLFGSIDPVTGGPSKATEPSPLDSMTEEAKEVEAEKLMGLIDQLNRYNLIHKGFLYNAKIDCAYTYTCDHLSMSM